MRRVIYRGHPVIAGETDPVVFVETLTEHVPIIALQENRIYGYVVKEDKGWIIKVGSEFGAYGHRTTLVELLQDGVENYQLRYYTN